jgi:hypothetical protein
MFEPQGSLFRLTSACQIAERDASHPLAAIARILDSCSDASARIAVRANGAKSINRSPSPRQVSGDHKKREANAHDIDELGMSVGGERIAMLEAVAALSSIAAAAKVLDYSYRAYGKRALVESSIALIGRRLVPGRAP